MRLIKTIDELRVIIKGKKDNNDKIGFVPTMGALHQGHLSLIKRAKNENEIVVVSIFVNPTQFGPKEDYKTYPRDIERDYKLAVEAGADIVFNPEVSEIYVDEASTFIQVEGDITNKLCGKSRPIHFKGVTTIVNILFNIVFPDCAYFGQKDAQQAVIIKKMVRDLHMNINIIVCPIVREEDGLAMSSRNVYLSEEERKQAIILNKSLKVVVEKFNDGEKSVKLLKTLIINTISSQKLANIDYVEILNYNSLKEIEYIKEKALVAVAVVFGKTRLIDNVIIG